MVPGEESIFCHYLYPSLRKNPPCTCMMTFSPNKAKQTVCGMLVCLYFLHKETNCMPWIYVRTILAADEHAEKMYSIVHPISYFSSSALFPYSFCKVMAMMIYGSILIETISSKWLQIIAHVQVRAVLSIRQHSVCLIC